MNQTVLCSRPTLGAAPQQGLQRWIRTVAQHVTGRLWTGLQRCQRWRQQRRTYRALYALDDRTLRDLALSRSEIPFVAGQTTITQTRRRVVGTGLAPVLTGERLTTAV